MHCSKHKAKQNKNTKKGDPWGASISFFNPFCYEFGRDFNLTAKKEFRLEDPGFVGQSETYTIVMTGFNEKSMSFEAFIYTDTQKKPDFRWTLTLNEKTQQLKIQLKHIASGGIRDSTYLKKK